MTSPLDHCEDVADLINLYIAGGENPGDPVRVPLVNALEYYGAVAWDGRVWWTSTPPRMDRINTMPIRNAAECPWPPGRVNADTTVAEPPPEKVAGYIQQLPW